MSELTDILQEFPPPILIDMPVDVDVGAVLVAVEDMGIVMDDMSIDIDDISILYYWCEVQKFSFCLCVGYLEILKCVWLCRMRRKKESQGLGSAIYPCDELGQSSIRKV